MNLSEITIQLNQAIASCNTDLRDFQYLRKSLKGFSRPGSKSFFHRKMLSDEWAFHVGGRSELQFNIGFEDDMFRYGIAFSFEKSRSFPDISGLYPKVEFFNEWLRLNKDLVSDLEMWYYDSDRQGNFPPFEIPNHLLHEGVFIFLGKNVLISSITDDWSDVLSTFERLLPLYRFVESQNSEDRILALPRGIEFKEGCSVKKSHTTSQVQSGERRILLFHNDIQYDLYYHLKEKYPNAKIGTEAKTSTGSIDLWVGWEDGTRDYYEIKTNRTAQGCLRDALSQLLEYSYWPGCIEPRNLIVVGTPDIDESALQYLQRLREKLGVLLEYAQFKGGKLTSYK